MNRNDDDPLLEERDELPYRRRSRPIPASRRGFVRRAWRGLRIVLAGAAVVLPLLYGGALLVGFARRSSRFALDSGKNLVLEGNNYVTREEVLEALDAAPGEGTNLFALSLDEKRRQIEAIPWVRTATLARAYPNRLVIRLVERVPVAFVNVGGRVQLIDGDGIILEKPEHAAFDFPVLDGLSAGSTPAERRAQLALFQQFMRDWAREGPSSGWMLSEVDLGDIEDLKTLLVQGQDTIVVHFGHASFAERFHTFLMLLPEVRKTTPKIDSVDLRYPGQLVVNPQEAKPRSPEGRESESRRPEPSAAKHLRDLA